MSTQQVERLTALLARVQRNRSSSRGGNGASARQPVAAVAPPAAAPAPKRGELPVPSAPVPSAPSRGRHAPTPLEMALEGRVSQPAEQFTRPVDVAPVPTPAPAAAPARAAGRVLAEPITPEPSKPIVQVVSKQPPHAAASFGELLKRSLSLRPR